MTTINQEVNTIKNLFENMLTLDEKYESDNISQMFSDMLNLKEKYKINNIFQIFSNMLSLDKKYESDNIFQLFYDISIKCNPDDIKKLIVNFQKYNYKENIIINCLKLLQYGLSINELIMIMDYINQIQIFKHESKMCDWQPDFLKYCNELESIFFDPYQLPKLNEILYYVYKYQPNSESVNDKIFINIKPYIETKYINFIDQNLEWNFTDGKIINDNSKTNIILNHYYGNIFKIYYEFDLEFTVIDKQIIIDYNEIQKLNNYEIKIKFVWDDFVSSFITEFMDFKYDFSINYGYDFYVYGMKWDDYRIEKIERDIAYYNRKNKNKYVKLYGCFKNKDNIELDGVYTYDYNYHCMIFEQLRYYKDMKNKCTSFDKFIKELQLNIETKSKKSKEKLQLIVVSKSKKQEKKLKIKIEKIQQQESDDDKETVSDFTCESKSKD